MNSPLDDLRFCTSAEALIDHWLELREPGQLCPKKSDFTPMKMGKTLPDVFMTEWQSEDTIIVRVAGSRTTQVTKVDWTGSNILDTCLPEHRQLFEEFYFKLRSGKVAATAEHSVPHVVRSMVVRSLQLPLLDTDGEARFFVGITRLLPTHKRLKDYRELSNDADISLNVWYTDLTHSEPQPETKII